MNRDAARRGAAQKRDRTCIRRANNVVGAATLSQMHPDLTPLEHVDELQRLLAESESRPVLLFKHSYTCGVSMEALDELVAHLNDRHRTEQPPQYAMVTVQTHRAVSNAIAQKLGIRHETPQALLVKGGRVVWSASHFRVTAAAVDTALKNQS
jgi:bacillithiol system protein YtxJ